MQLKELLFGVSIDSVLGSTSVSIEGITPDSRALGVNSLFVAIRREHHDGHDHISDAVKKGAVAVLCEELPSWRLPLAGRILLENVSGNLMARCQSSDDPRCPVSFLCYI